MPGSMNIMPFSEGAIFIRFEHTSIPDANKEVMKLYRHLKEHPFPGYIESVPAYDSITIIYNPREAQKKNDSPFDGVINEIINTSSLIENSRSAVKTHEIPVYYGGQEGPDLVLVAEENGISPEELIRLHTGTEYDVFMIGFAGGFPYMGFTDEKLFTSRKSKPEKSVPAGSVALAGNQTGIYPFETPGAWKIIGRTSYLVFDPKAENPAIIKPGDKIKFVKA